MNISELMYDLEECKLEVESVLWDCEVLCSRPSIFSGTASVGFLGSFRSVGSGRD